MRWPPFWLAVIVAAVCLFLPFPTAFLVGAGIGVWWFVKEYNRVKREQNNSGV